MTSNRLHRDEILRQLAVERAILDCYERSEIDDISRRPAPYAVADVEWRIAVLERMLLELELFPPARHDIGAALGRRAVDLGEDAPEQSPFTFMGMVVRAVPGHPSNVVSIGYPDDPASFVHVTVKRSEDR